MNTKQDAKCDALIIGGGPAGSTAALLLAKAGFSVVIVEKTAFPRRKVCGEYLSATNLRLFHELGIYDDFVRLAGPEISRVGLFSGDTKLTAAMPRPEKFQNHWGRALRREVLDALLLERAARVGATVWQPWSTITTTTTNEGFVSLIESKEGSETSEVRSRIVIAAHGSWEIGPLSTQPKRQKLKPSDLLGFKAHFQNPDLPADLMPMIVFPGGYGGMVTCDSGFASISCCIRNDMLQTVRDRFPHLKAGEAVGQHIFDTCRGVHDALSNAKLYGEWLSAGPIRSGIRSRYKNGIFIIGNAAGESHPIIAEGISMAIQSAWLLCEKLIGHMPAELTSQNQQEIAADYDSEWLHAFTPRIKASEIFAYLALNDRSHTVLSKLMNTFPSLLTLGAKLSGKVNQVAA